MFACMHACMYALIQYRERERERERSHYCISVQSSVSQLGCVMSEFHNPCASRAAYLWPTDIDHGTAPGPTSLIASHWSVGRQSCRYPLC